MSYTAKEFNDMFTVVSNSANGNCFFEAMEYLLEGTKYHLTNLKEVPSAAEIRFMVGEFYRNFDKDIDYPEDTIENRIKLGIMFDNIDEEMPHDYNIYNDKVWASMTDVIVCSLLFDVNIRLFKYNSWTNMYEREVVNPQYNFTDTINLLYNGINHFEALSC